VTREEAFVKGGNVRNKRFFKGSLWAGLHGHVTLIAFVLFVLLAGSNAVAIRFSNVGLPPFWGAAARFGAAALIFWAIVLAGRIAVPRGRGLIGSLLYGVIGVGVAFALIYWALVRVQAGMASIFLALVPLPTVFLAAAHGLEPLRWRRVAGALVAVGGIALIVIGRLGNGLTLPVLLALMSIPVAMAEGAVLIKDSPQSSPMATNAVAFSVGAVILAGLSLLSGEKWSLPADATTWAVFGYLIIGAVLFNYLWLFVLARWPATRVAYGPVLYPVVSVAMSAWLTGEVVTATFVLGAAVALAGVWLGAISRPARAAAPAPAPGPEMVDCGAHC
jgi:drug/metabolite transporter (DMT)-like permease